MKRHDPVFHFLTKPYVEDIPLMVQLGLKEYQAEHAEKVFVGKVKDKDYGHVKIWVTCMPAQFWKFEIFCKETGHTTVFSTGSGSLSDYWEVAEKIMQGMIAIKGVKK